MKENYLYLEIAGEIEGQIQKGLLTAGDKLPSVRAVCLKYNVSMSTAQMAYFTLISKSLIESKPKSGYIVSNWLKNSLELPQTSNPKMVHPGKTDDALVSSIFESINNKKVTRFALGAPASELLPIRQLNRAVSGAIKDLSGCGTEYDSIEGNSDLRKHLAKWFYKTGAQVLDNEIVTTSGCLNAIAYCLMATTKPGDAIAIESPAFFGLLQLFQSLGLRVIELPTNATTGIEIDALEKVLSQEKINACLLVSNFSNPLGSCMPDEHKQEIVKLLNHYNVPLIEDDLYGDLYFGNNRPKTCKAFDKEGMVLCCSSVSKTIAPGYRVGWIAPGKFKEKIVRLKMVNAIASTTLTHQAIANFFQTGGYENHIRKLRHTLHSNCLQYTQAITNYFPEDTKISRPQGGLFLWVELNKSINTVDLYKKALQNNIVIAPGKVFSLQNQFNNCMRLNYGLLWSEKIENDLKLLAELLY